MNGGTMQKHFIIPAAILLMSTGLAMNSNSALAQSGGDAGNNAVGQPGSYDYSPAYIDNTRLRAEHPPGSMNATRANGLYISSGYSSVRTGDPGRSNTLRY